MHYPFYRRRVLLTSLIAASINGTALAEETNIPTISVTAPTLVETQTLNSTTLDKEALQSLVPATSDTASLLKNIPGLNLQGSGGVSSLPVIHGLADDRLRIKVNGMDLISACGNHMNPALSYIDPTNVGSITTFAGITPVSVGGDSIGGTILVDSADPEFAKAGEGLLTKGEAGAFYRSNGNANGGNLSATIANETYSLTYQASTATSDNYTAGGDFKAAGLAAAGRGYLSADEVGSSKYKSTNQSLSLATRTDNHMVELTLGLQDIPYQGWTNQRMDMTGNDSEQINLRYEGDFDWGKLETRAYNEHTRHRMQFADDKLYWYGSNTGVPTADGEVCTPSGGMTGCAAGMPMDTEGDNTGVVVKADIPLANNDLLRVGGEIQQYRLDDWWDPSGKGMWPDTFWNINDGERDRFALFAEWEAKLNTQWQTQLGIRGEQVTMNTGEVQGYNTTSADYLAESTAFNAADRKKTDNNIDLTALARYTPEKTKTIEVGFARKTRSPNLYERYTWSTGGMAMRMINWAGDGNGYVGNLDLEPEVANTLSATFDWHDAAQNKWGFKMTPYYTYIQDYIDVERCTSTVNTNCGAANQTVTDAYVYLQFVNQSASMYGIDISGHFPLAENTAYGNFTARGILNYVRGKNETTGDNLYNIMPLNARLAFEQQKDNWTNIVEVEAVGDKTDVSAVRNEVATKAYGLLHLRSSYQWKKVRLDVGIENVLDKLYNHPLGGAYMGQGKTMSGTDVPWGVLVPGMGRSIYAGVNVKF
ncbi:MAG: TonB-dependent receptor [Gammaproteobacteria bacterium]|nr:TonB-dependent receptor [Gammaproteobacteria bacterium]MCW8987191.1 TonB-dependent receptor [Gammaproteobacteria bacterium]MCW9031646.1 TonB-dependent receptor [Gammaproteobacteria bacterium]